MDTLTLLGGLVACITIGGVAVQAYRTWKWKRKFNWDSALRTSRALLESVENSNWQPDIIVGIGRSGGIWGGWMAGNLGSLPFYVIDNIYGLEKDNFTVSFPDADLILEAINRTYPGKTNILFVMGASSSGSTYMQLKEQVNTNRQFSFKYAVLYQNPTAKFRVDYAGHIGPSNWPKTFPWHERKGYRPYLRDIFGS